MSSWVTKPPKFSSKGKPLVPVEVKRILKGTILLHCQ